MYNQFFGLRASPFQMTPDPAYLFMTIQHREALAGLTYAVLERKGLVVLTGDAGTGKTTLLRWVLEHLPPARIQSSVVFNPVLTSAEFLEMALRDFGIPEAPANKAKSLLKLQELLHTGDQAGKVSVLVVDEAHKLSPELLEEIRLLGNFERSDRKLLQIVLAGQNELTDVLNRHDLRQFKQRIALRVALEPLSAPEIGQYIQFRWSKAGGGNPAPFSAEALVSVARFSQGIPRLINSLCDNALMLALAAGSTNVTAEHLTEASADLCLTNGVPAEGPRPVPALQAPAPALQVLRREASNAPNGARIPTLERYAPSKPSTLSRWAGKLGLARRAKTA